jgi:hypothetical protein
MHKNLHLRAYLPLVLSMVQKSQILFPTNGIKIIYMLFAENANFHCHLSLHVFDRLVQQIAGD